MTDYAGNRGSWSSSAPLTATNTDRNTSFGMPAAAGTIHTGNLDSLQASLNAVASILNTSQPTFSSGVSAAPVTTPWPMRAIRPTRYAAATVYRRAMPPRGQTLDSRAPLAVRIRASSVRRFAMAP